MRILPIRESNYGFTDAGPSGHTYAVTGDYDDVARNHCAATMLTNAALLLCPDAPLCRDRRQLFLQIHRIVGNGPILHLQNGTNRCFRSLHLPLRCRQIRRRRSDPQGTSVVQILAAECAAGRPCALLVAASLFQWHWVLALSVQQTRDGACSILITDGWHAARNVRYVPDQGARLMAICTFHIGDH